MLQDGKPVNVGPKVGVAELYIRSDQRSRKNAGKPASTEGRASQQLVVEHDSIRLLTESICTMVSVKVAMTMHSRLGSG